MTRRRTLLLATAAIAVVGVTAAAGLTHRGGTPAAPLESPAAAAATRLPGSAPSPADPGRPTPTDRAVEVTWGPGPWGPIAIAGHPLLVPASPTDGPLRDRGDGWASDYAPTPIGAAIALLRGPWFVFAAPAALRPQVVAAVLTPAAAAEPGPVNPAEGWAIPGELLAGLAAQDVRLLGAVSRLTDPERAVVDVFQELATPTGPVVIRSTHDLTYTKGQWLIEANYSDSTGEQIPPNGVPSEFTVTGPQAAT